MSAFASLASTEPLELRFTRIIETLTH
jgi:hypothetical protein